MTQDRTRRLAAVWFADIVGYTDLSSRDEDLALQVVRELQRITRVQCDARGGRVVKLVGDGILTVFDSTDGAVRAAVNVRDAFLHSLEARTADVSLRVGLHLGDVAEGLDGDVYGDAVNAASRIEGVAEPGQVLMSEVAYRLLKQQSSIQVQDIGEHDLKGLGPTKLYAATAIDSAPVEDLQDLLQDQLAPLQLLGREGMGGMGAIYLARDPGLRRTLAVKVLRTELAADRDARARFMREAQVIAGLSHPNIVGVHSVGELKDGTPYFVMDYVEGGSLDTRLEEEGPLSAPETRRILGEVASALAAAHERGVVHRDIKASNILYDADSGRSLVSDWGIAALDPAVELSPDTRLTRTGAVIGSPKYMSPEQLAGDEVGPESDLYALGLLAFELLTGQGPFPDQTPRALMVAHLREDAPALTAVREDVDPELETLIAQCLAKSPEDRPTADRIAQRLAPGAETRLEWPPPGLDGLLGKGRRIAVAAVAGLALMHLPLMAALLQVQLPEAVTYALQRGTRTQVLPFAIMTSGALLTAYALLQAVVAGVMWRRGVGLGYGWLTLAEVASDERGDTGTLVSGGREYVSLAPAERKRLRLLRLFAVAAPLAAALLLVLLPPMAPAFAAPRGGRQIVLWTLLFGPSTLLVLLGAVAEGREVHLVGANRRQLRKRKAPSRSLTGLVGPWYSSLDESSEGTSIGPGLRGRVWLAWTTVLATVLLLGLALFSQLPAAVLIVAAPYAADRGPPDATSIQRRVDDAQIGRPFVLTPAPAIDATAAAFLWDSLRSSSQAGDSAWQNRPSAFVIRGSPLVTGGGPFGSCSADAERCPQDLINPDSVLIAAARGLSVAERDYLRTFGHNPRFAPFSRLAIASGFDDLRLAEIMSGAPLFGETTTWWDVPIPKFSGAREIAYFKIGYAGLSYAEGDVTGAETTLREVLSVGLLLVDDATALTAALVGAVLANMAIDNLQRLYTLTGQVENAAALQRGVAIDDESNARRLDAPIESVLRDSTIIRQLKFELLPWFLFGESCFSPRALLRGPSPEIRQLVNGPLREELVRTDLEADLYATMFDWERRHAAIRPANNRGLPGLVLQTSWKTARFFGNDRAASCLALAGGF